MSAGSVDFSRAPNMSRNFYILAATLVFFALLSGGMSLVPSSFQPGLPANGSLWRTVPCFCCSAGWPPRSSAS